MKNIIVLIQIIYPQDQPNKQKADEKILFQYLQNSQKEGGTQ